MCEPVSIASPQISFSDLNALINAPISAML